MNDLMTLKQGILLYNNTYRIVRVLGQGGFGITYLAEHVRLKKQVAIKEFFPKSLCNRDSDTSQVRTATDANSELVQKLRKKFLKEAEHIAAMDSAYIVNITDVFEENGTVYYIMDYIEGITLLEVVKKNGPLSEQKAIEYISKIGEALSYIHSKRMNHLDVKPANIIIRKKDDVPILIDFGLSKQYDSEGNQTSTTPHGFSHGYAPMEQYNDGGVKNFSPQTDLYSLAATLYFLLSGIVPPHASTLLEDNLTFPSLIPKKLIPIIQQAMSPKRGNRQEAVRNFSFQLLKDNIVDESTSIEQQNKNYETIKATVKNKSQQGKEASKERFESKGTCSHQKEMESMSKVERKILINKNRRNALLYFAIAGILFLGILWLSNDGKGNRDNTEVIPAEIEDSIQWIQSENPPAETEGQYGAPLSDGEKEDGRGGFDDNAEGYFNMYADTYVTSNRDVYFDGSFSDSKGTYPILLKFELDDNWHAGICYYHNVEYGTKLKMSVRFTEEQMVVTGNAGGSQFTMKFIPTTDGKWKGSAQNGNHNLNANIWPIQMP